jgi:RNA-directed DNA polymerase
MAEIAKQLNPLLRGWIEYYGRYTPSALGPFLRYVNRTLQGWVMRKFKSLKGHKTRARLFLTRLAGECPFFFAHWKLDKTGSFA